MLKCPVKAYFLHFTILKCQKTYENDIPDGINNYHPLFKIFQKLKILTLAVTLKIHRIIILNQKNKKSSHQLVMRRHSWYAEEPPWDSTKFCWKWRVVLMWKILGSDSKNRLPFLQRLRCIRGMEVWRLINQCCSKIKT